MIRIAAVDWLCKTFDGKCPSRVLIRGLQEGTGPSGDLEDHYIVSPQSPDR